MVTSPRTDWTEPEQRAIREQVGRILRSRTFLHSQRRQRFLAYIVNETLAGRGDGLKGYNVAVAVFDRPITFDPVIDPVVRIEAARLREKIRDYYVSEGLGDSIRIELPKGSYVPQIEFRPSTASLPSSPMATSDGQSATGRGAPASDRPSLAVLPFVNMSTTRSNDYLSDGLADTLITDLAKISGLSVVSRHSSFFHRNSKQTLSEIAETLRVRYLVEGSVHSDGERIRVVANLVDTMSDRAVWAERYERKLADIFAIQDDVARNIANVLRIRLTSAESERVGKPGTQSLEAHKEMLKGLEQFWRYSRQSCAEAQAYFSHAVDLDPSYAAPHAWLARTYIFQYSMNWVADLPSTLAAALSHARRAVELDDQSPLAHSILGWILLFHKDGARSLAEVRRAVALDPNSAEAMLFQSLILASTGHGGEALTSIETAMLLQPHPSSFYFYALGLSHFALHDYARAAAALMRGIEINPSFMPNHYELAIVHAVSGDGEAARAEAALVRADWPHVSKDFYLDPALATTYAAGKRAAGLA